jgi:hypothetical protein
MMRLNLRHIETTDLVLEMIARIIESDREAMAVTSGIIELLRKMSAGLSEQRRFEVAEKLRDAADALERPIADDAVFA